ncbi:protein-L-isoaspartate(D-aspartate) O-methyltransferase [Alteribacillus bidgolensis]|uniref:Protein-L-isoaspartate O-methyltransferase n=1 Tax=Alteribacillus bidgolensis TaxID=930129 RepID=A0A1G8QGK2_9BACI|nr:protein-L-isoaspartate(D-aspartate) O-methyltransferase [Alteribacillus bidgolensis]SDJ03210.1 protein-L-isoaspartate(D-aspartate) O-methyltransferase [Alteribacillus bidgolensis]
MKNQEQEIIKYFRKMDRSFYMDKDKDMAHMDQAVAIGHGQTISQPSLVLEMTLTLNIQPDSKVLEIGTGSGFQTDLLASFSKSVFTVERITPLHFRAKEKLREAGLSNISFKLGDGSQGWEENAPYDRIMVTAAAADVPSELVSQMAAGGKMVIPVGTEWEQKLLLIEKDEQGETCPTFIKNVMFVSLKRDSN